MHTWFRITLLATVFYTLGNGQWESQTASITANAFGKCPWMSISSSSNIQQQPGQFYAVSMRASEKEITEYNVLPGMLTRSNPKLGLGIVKGAPQAVKWANNTVNSWQLAADHPRNDKANCVRVSRLTGEAPVEIYDAYKRNADFYVINAVNAVIHEAGIIGLPCGYFQPLEGCETIFKYIGRKWWNRCNDQFKKAKTEWPTYWKEKDDKQLSIFNATGCRDQYKGAIQRYDKVFVITASWDHNYHHFMIDSLSRLARHVDFLRDNPDIKIHIRRFDQYAKEERAFAGIKMRHYLAELLGISSARFVSGIVLADQVYLPRAVKCNYPISSALEIRLLASLLKDKAARMGKESELVPVDHLYLERTRKRVVLQHRPCTTDKECLLWRYWNDTVADSFAQSLGAHLPTFRVTVDNSKDKRISDCMACQVLLYSKTNMLVGLHGAGLTNMIFMPPGSLVVEIVGQFDGRMLPLCGYHGALAAVFGIHHYIYYYDWKGGEALDVDKIAAEAASYQRFLSK